MTIYRRFPDCEPAQPRPCKLCGTESPLFGAIDFNKKNNLWLNFEPLLQGDLIFYNRCPGCDLLFTSDFDSWSHQDFKDHIYNEFYDKIDSLSERRVGLNRDFFDKHFSSLKKSGAILDYGGGDGLFSRYLRGCGFEDVTVYEPFIEEFKELPDRQFDIVTCFEVIEHVPDPDETIDRLASLTKQSGIVYFTTLPLPKDFEECGVFWWYISPRAGHISIFSEESLVMAWNKRGFTLVNFDESHFFAFREKPNFAAIQILNMINISEDYALDKNVD
jgi:2-polyprenyl-6-hydroxyphenyl methylase/3-demethylubiquinone-9 3-methyltransferase